MSLSLELLAELMFPLNHRSSFYFSLKFELVYVYLKLNLVLMRIFIFLFDNFQSTWASEFFVYHNQILPALLLTSARAPWKFLNLRTSNVLFQNIKMCSFFHKIWIMLLPIFEHFFQSIYYQSQVYLKKTQWPSMATNKKA